MRLPIEEIKKLKEEFEYRTTSLRDEINDELNQAISLGDLPENFPYDAAVERQLINENRINDLEKILREVEYSQKNNKEISKGQGIISTGNKIKIDMNGKEFEVVLVDNELMERNPRQGFISVISPLGKELIGKKVGDEVEVSAPIGKVKYKILEVRN